MSSTSYKNSTSHALRDVEVAGERWVTGIESRSDPASARACSRLLALYEHVFLVTFWRSRKMDPL